MISTDIKIEEKTAVRKKYLKFKIPNFLNKYIIINNKKNLKNNMDFVNLTKLILSYPSKYKAFTKLIVVDKKIIKKNKKINFIERSNFTFNISGFK